MLYVETGRCELTVALLSLLGAPPNLTSDASKPQEKSSNGNPGEFEELGKKIKGLIPLEHPLLPLLFISPPPPTSLYSSLGSRPSPFIHAKIRKTI